MDNNSIKFITSKFLAYDVKYFCKFYFILNKESVQRSPSLSLLLLISLLCIKSRLCLFPINKFIKVIHLLIGNDMKIHQITYTFKIKFIVSFFAAFV